MDSLENIYSQHDTAVVEANKKLPKPCYGNSSGHYCNYECPTNQGCYSVTMAKWGICDCQFKPSCHISRQKLQAKFKQNNINHICPFKEYFDEHTYPSIIIPKGIIKMKPIRE